MHKKIAIVVVCALMLLAAGGALADPPKKGFLKGPYLDIQIGVTQADYDTDQTTGAKVGHDFEPGFGFIFGWNLFDSFSTEIAARYITTLNGGRREHIAGANLFAKYTLVTKWLTDFPTFRVLPYAKGGIGTHIAILPSALGADSSHVYDFGYGPSVGAGVAFLWKKYFHFGVDAQEDLLFFDNVNQTVFGIPNVLVYKGGFHPAFSISAFFGVHY